MEDNTVYEWHWQKVCEYLTKTNHETVKFTFLERMEQICWGFGEYMLDEYTVEERIGFPMLEALDRKRRQLKKKKTKQLLSEICSDPKRPSMKCINSLNQCKY